MQAHFLGQLSRTCSSRHTANSLLPRTGVPPSRRDAPFQNQMPHGGQKRAAGEVYIPKIYGFRVSERAKSGPRMKWLRMRPQTAEELDMVDWRGRWIGSDDGYEEDEEVRRIFAARVTLTTVL